MTDNTNIEALPDLPANRMAWEYPDETFVYCEEQMIEYGLLCRRAALSNAEPVGEVGAMPGTEGFTMACFLANEVPIGTKLFLHPNVPAPTDKNEKRLRYIYKQAMKRLVKPCMTYEEYIAALDVDVNLPLTNTGEQW